MIAAVVVIIIAAIAAVSTPVLVIAAVVVFLGSLLYGVLAGDNATVWVSALVGIGVGVAALAAPSWLAGWRALTWMQLLKQALTSGVVNSGAGLVLDFMQGAATGDLSPKELAINILANFAKGFLAGLFFAPVGKGLESFRFRGIALKSVEWRWQVGFLRFVSKAGLAISLKGLIDGAQHKATTLLQLLITGVLGGLFSFFRTNIFKGEPVNDLAEETSQELSERWINFSILPWPRPKNPPAPQQCEPHKIGPVIDDGERRGAQ